jgi:hypothetical protein
LLRLFAGRLGVGEYDHGKIARKLLARSGYNYVGGGGFLPVQSLYGGRYARLNNGYDVHVD